MGTARLWVPGTMDPHQTPRCLGAGHHVPRRTLEFSCGHGWEPAKGCSLFPRPVYRHLFLNVSN